MVKNLLATCWEITKQRSLLLKTVLIALSIALLLSFLYNFLIFHSYSKKVSNDILKMSDIIGSVVAGDEMLLNGSLDYLYSYDLKKILQDFDAQRGLITQINLLSAGGFYVSSSESENIGKKAGAEVFNFIKEEQNNFKLTRLKLAYSDTVIDAWQYARAIKLQKSSQELFLQILYDAKKVQALNIGFGRYFMSLIAMMLLLPIIVIVFFYKTLAYNIKKLQLIGKQDFEVESATFEGEFVPLLNKLTRQYFELQKNRFELQQSRIQSKSVASRAELGAKNEHSLSSLKFNLVILGIKVTNFSAATSGLKTDDFTKTIDQLYQTYQNLAVDFEAVLLKYDGHLVWLGFKGNKQYQNCLAAVQAMQVRIVSFKEETRCALLEPLKLVFLIDKGDVTKASIQEGKNQVAVTVLGGKEMNVARGLIDNLEEGEIWATNNVEDGLSFLCRLTKAPKLNQFWEGFSNNLFSVSLLENKPQGSRLGDPGDRNSQLNAEEEPQNKSSATGMTSVLEDTLKDDL